MTEPEPEPAPLSATDYLRDRDLDVIQTALQKSQGRGKLFSYLLFALGLLCAARYVPEEKYDLAAVSVAVLGGIGAFLYRFAMRADPRRSAVARALVERPETVTDIVHYTSSSSSGAMTMDWLRVHVGQQKLAFRLYADDAAELAEALARQCPNARIEIPGVLERKRPAKR